MRESKSIFPRTGIDRLRRLTSELPADRPLPDIYRRLGSSTEQAAAGGPLARDARLAVLEAILFAAAEPLTPRRLAQSARLKDAGEARRLIRKLQGMYAEDGSAFQLEEIAGGFQLLTRPEFYRWLARLKLPSTEIRLTGPARETLAIVAYRQPIMRSDIEAIRGVQSGEVLRHLMELGLVRIAGRHDSLGRPVLYGTSKKFLQLFGLKGLKELPAADGPS